MRLYLIADRVVGASPGETFPCSKSETIQRYVLLASRCKFCVRSTCHALIPILQSQCGLLVRLGMNRNSGSQGTAFQLMGRWMEIPLDIHGSRNARL
jgi:hypothetical protein